MCLAIPMKIIKTSGEFAEVESGRLRRKANIAMIPRAAVGDYVMVHAGFAIEIMDQKRAEQTLRLIDEIR